MPKITKSIQLFFTIDLFFAIGSLFAIWVLSYCNIDFLWWVALLLNVFSAGGNSWLFVDKIRNPQKWT